MTALHERNNRQHMPIAANFDVGGIVMVKGEKQKRREMEDWNNQ